MRLMDSADKTRHARKHRRKNYSLAAKPAWRTVMRRSPIPVSVTFLALGIRLVPKGVHLVRLLRHANERRPLRQFFQLASPWKINK